MTNCESAPPSSVYQSLKIMTSLCIFSQDLSMYFLVKDSKCIIVHYVIWNLQELTIGKFFSISHGNDHGLGFHYIVFLASYKCWNSYHICNSKIMENSPTYCGPHLFQFCSCTCCGDIYFKFLLMCGDILNNMHN